MDGSLGNHFCSIPLGPQASFGGDFGHPGNTEQDWKNAEGSEMGGYLSYLVSPLRYGQPQISQWQTRKLRASKNTGFWFRIQQAFLCPPKALAEACQETLPHSASSKHPPHLCVPHPPREPSIPKYYYQVEDYADHCQGPCSRSSVDRPPGSEQELCKAVTTRPSTPNTRLTHSVGYKSSRLVYFLDFCFKKLWVICKNKPTLQNWKFAVVYNKKTCRPWRCF